ncbi:hypothetical protein RIM91_34860, partial [Pseudomonas aeruginosa]|uniref:hypothetical protein n=1 Tax=Pseudomonas aeruginosa TaxID=287 RepID=UPI002E76928A
VVGDQWVDGWLPENALNLWLLYRLNLRLLRCRRRPHFRRRRNQHTRIGICGRIAINGADRCRWI